MNQKQWLMLFIGLMCLNATFGVWNVYEYVFIDASIWNLAVGIFGFGVAYYMFHKIKTQAYPNYLIEEQMNKRGL